MISTALAIAGFGATNPALLGTTSLLKLFLGGTGLAGFLIGYFMGGIAMILYGISLMLGDTPTGQCYLDSSKKLKSLGKLAALFGFNGPGAVPKALSFLFEVADTIQGAIEDLFSERLHRRARDWMEDILAILVRNQCARPESAMRT